MKKRAVLLLSGAMGLLAVILFSGCATTLSKSEYNIDMLSKKPGMTFKITNRKGTYVHKGTTPEYVVLPAQSESFTGEIYKIKAENGVERKITATITPIYWANVLGFVGFLVDGITGAMWSLPNVVHVDTKEKLLGGTKAVGTSL